MMPGPVSMFARMLRAGLNLDQWPTDALEREVARLLDIAEMELAPAGAAAALADALERDEYEPDDERSYPPRDLARERANHERRQRAAGGTDGNAPADLVTVSGITAPAHLSPLLHAIEGRAARIAAGAGALLDRPERGGRSAADLVTMHARTLRVSAGAEPAPPGVPVTFEPPALYQCARCHHHHAPGTFCGEPLPPAPRGDNDPDTCQCDTRDA